LVNEQSGIGLRGDRPVGENDSGDSALLVRRLWALRLAVLPWLALVLGPTFIALKDLVQPAI
jgi:hypothetical protein